MELMSSGVEELVADLIVADVHVTVVLSLINAVN